MTEIYDSKGEKVDNIVSIEVSARGDTFTNIKIEYYADDLEVHFAGLEDVLPQPITVIEERPPSLRRVRRPGDQN